VIALGCGHLAFGGQGFDLSDMGTRTPNGHGTDALARLSKKEEEAEVRSMPPPGKTVTLADVPSGSDADMPKPDKIVSYYRSFGTVFLVIR
jgi:hypothetical protein